MAKEQKTQQSAALGLSLHPVSELRHRQDGNDADHAANPVQFVNRGEEESGMTAPRRYPQERTVLRI
jgi:hypothetical protein